MSDISYQNQDLENTNPIQITQEINATKQPKDPKIKLLIILSGIIVLLLIITTIISINNSGTPRVVRVAEPTIIITPRPTDLPVTNIIPENLQKKFDQLDNNIRTGIDFPPPQIDTEIGL
jgi:hypothetical protein